MNILQDKTFGDEKNISDKTPIEILEEIKNKIRTEEEGKYNKELESHNKTKKEKDSVEQEKCKIEKEKQSLEEKLSEKDKKVKALCGKTAKYISNFLFCFLILINIYIFYVATLKNSEAAILKRTSLYFALVISLLNIIFGFNIIQIKDKTKNIIELFFLKLFSD